MVGDDEHDDDELWPASDDDDDDDTSIAQSASQTKATRQPYMVLNVKAIEAQVEELVERVSSVLQISKDASRLLLQKSGWDCSKALTIFFDLDEATQASLSHLKDELPDLHVGEKFDCEVCCETVCGDNGVGLPCGHKFCRQCMKDYLRDKVRNKTSHKSVSCMGCSALLNDATIVELLVSDEDRERHNTYRIESFVDDNSQCTWCPALNCGRTLLAQDVTCECGHDFCFQCQGICHGPANCRMMKEWDSHIANDAASAAYLSTNTVYCPKCNNAVEKSTGCNLMTCRCGQHFCYLCGGKTGFAHTWTSIAGHECGRFKEDSAESTNKDRMRRFIFYQKRWSVHDDSHQKEADLMGRVSQMVGELVYLSRDPENLRLAEYMEEALIRLVECRHVLANSYIFCFYVFGDNQLVNWGLSKEKIEICKPLFEDFQQGLESKVEMLSGLMEKSLDYLREHSHDVFNLSKDVERRCKNVFDFVHNQIFEESSSQFPPYTPELPRDFVRHTV